MVFVGPIFHLEEVFTSNATMKSLKIDSVSVCMILDIKRSRTKETTWETVPGGRWWPASCSWTGWCSSEGQWVDLPAIKAERGSKLKLFNCGVFKWNFFPVWVFQLCARAIDELDATAWWPAWGLSKLFFTACARVEGFPSVPASPLLTQMLEHTDVA